MKNTLKNSPTNPSFFKTKLAFRFLKAMKKLNKISSSPPMADKDKRYHANAIRAAAYASMASAVGPRKLWSRAILRKTRNHKLIMKDRKNDHVGKRAITMRGNPRNDQFGFGQELNDLSDVVPGGKAMDSCRLLNETGHYIKCLRAQVQVMRKILDYSSRS